MPDLRAVLNMDCKPLDAGVMERIGTLVSNVNTSPEENLGDEALI